MAAKNSSMTGQNIQVGKSYLRDPRTVQLVDGTRFGAGRKRLVHSIMHARSAGAIISASR